MEEKNINLLDLAELRKRFLGKTIIQNCDMNDDMKQEVSDQVASAIESSQVPQWSAELAARTVKEFLDKKYGPTWQVIIGEGFAYDVTVQNNTKMFMFQNGSLAILVFKS